MSWMPAKAPEKRKILFILGGIIIIAVLTVVFFNGYMVSPKSEVNILNLSGEGIDYSGLTCTPLPTDVVRTPQLAEDAYLRRIPMDFQNGSDVWVVERSGSTDPAYGALISLLMDDPTEHEIYNESQTCTNFAVRLHDTAELNGMKAHIVVITFQDGGIPHMINAFNTTDKGIVYVDDTGLTLKQLYSGIPDIDRLATVTPGQPYQTNFIPPFDERVDPLDLGIVKKVVFVT